MGDICKVEKDESFPADLLLVSAEKDLVFVDTMNLDGETNLKERMIPFDEKIQLSEFSGDINCDMPNESLKDWDANINSA
jgi:P-type E1-E2 ATPase